MPITKEDLFPSGGGGGGATIEKWDITPTITPGSYPSVSTATVNGSYDAATGTLTPNLLSGSAGTCIQDLDGTIDLSGDPGAVIGVGQSLIGNVPTGGGASSLFVISNTPADAVSKVLDHISVPGGTPAVPGDLIIAVQFFTTGSTNTVQVMVYSNGAWTPFAAYPGYTPAGSNQDVYVSYRDGAVHVSALFDKLAHATVTVPEAVNALSTSLFIVYNGGGADLTVPVKYTLVGNVPQVFTTSPSYDWIAGADAALTNGEYFSWVNGAGHLSLGMEEVITQVTQLPTGVADGDLLLTFVDPSFTGDVTDVVPLNQEVVLHDQFLQVSGGGTSFTPIEELDNYGGDWDVTPIFSPAQLITINDVTSVSGTWDDVTRTHTHTATDGPLDVSFTTFDRTIDAGDSNVAVRLTPSVIPGDNGSYGVVGWTENPANLETDLLALLQSQPTSGIIIGAIAGNQGGSIVPFLLSQVGGVTEQRGGFEVMESGDSIDLYMASNGSDMSWFSVVNDVSASTYDVSAEVTYTKSSTTLTMFAATLISGVIPSAPINPVLTFLDVASNELSVTGTIAESSGTTQATFDGLHSSDYADVGGLPSRLDPVAALPDDARVGRLYSVQTQRVADENVFGYSLTSDSIVMVNSVSPPSIVPLVPKLLPTTEALTTTGTFDIALRSGIVDNEDNLVYGNYQTAIAKAVELGTVDKPAVLNIQEGSTTISWQGTYNIDFVDVRGPFSPAHRGRYNDKPTFSMNSNTGAYWTMSPDSLKNAYRANFFSTGTSVFKTLYKEFSDLFFDQGSSAAAPGIDLTSVIGTMEENCRIHVKFTRCIFEDSGVGSNIIFLQLPDASTAWTADNEYQIILEFEDCGTRSGSNRIEFNVGSNGGGDTVANTSLVVINNNSSLPITIKGRIQNVTYNLYHGSVITGHLDPTLPVDFPEYQSEGTYYNNKLQPQFFVNDLSSNFKIYANNAKLVDFSERFVVNNNITADTWGVEGEFRNCLTASAALSGLSNIGSNAADPILKYDGFTARNDAGGWGLNTPYAPDNNDNLLDVLDRRLLPNRGTTEAVVQSVDTVEGALLANNDPRFSDCYYVKGVSYKFDNTFDLEGPRENVYTSLQTVVDRISAGEIPNLPIKVLPSTSTISVSFVGYAGSPLTIIGVPVYHYAGSSDAFITNNPSILVTGGDADGYLNGTILGGSLVLRNTGSTYHPFTSMPTLADGLSGNITLEAPGTVPEMVSLQSNSTMLSKGYHISLGSRAIKSVGVVSLTLTGTDSVRPLPPLKTHYHQRVEFSNCYSLGSTSIVCDDSNLTLNLNGMWRFNTGNSPGQAYSAPVVSTGMTINALTIPLAMDVGVDLTGITWGQIGTNNPRGNRVSPDLDTVVIREMPYAPFYYGTTFRAYDYMDLTNMEYPLACFMKWVYVYTAQVGKTVEFQGLRLDLQGMNPATDGLGPVGKTTFRDCEFTSTSTFALSYETVSNLTPETFTGRTLLTGGTQVAQTGDDLYLSESPTRIWDLPYADIVVSSRLAANPVFPAATGDVNILKVRSLTDLDDTQTLFGSDDTSTYNIIHVSHGLSLNAGSLANKTHYIIAEPTARGNITIPAQTSGATVEILYTDRENIKEAAGTAYNVTELDFYLNTRIVTTDNGGTVGITVPDGLVIDEGSTIGIEQGGTSTCSVIPGATGSVNSVGGNLTIAGQYGAATLRAEATANVYTLRGDLIA